MRFRISVPKPDITLLTTIIVATPSITLIMLAKAINRVRKYRWQSKSLYIANPLAECRPCQKVECGSLPAI
jgi:hypothetical protein